MERRGEKIGWIGGWLGGFLWVAVLAAVFLCQGKTVSGISGLLLFMVAAVAIFSAAPWRHPVTPYWKLMLFPYALFFMSAAWALWTFGGIGQTGLNEWNLLWILPVLIPAGVAGRRKWTDGDPSGD